MRPPTGLILITDRRSAAHPLETICAAALEAGFAGVMLREKDLPARPLLELAQPLAALCRESGAMFWVNERLDVALAVAGAGGHVGSRGLSVPASRALLGADRSLGYSAHEADEARRALDQGADFVFLSPVFPGVSKPEAPARGFTWFRDAVTFLPPRTVFALGGVTAKTVGQVMACGAAGAAVMGTVMRAGDPGRVAREIASAAESAGSS